VGHTKKSDGFIEWLGHFPGSWPCYASLEASSLVCMWSLWHERNARLFEDVELLVVDLCQNVLNMLYVWVSAHSPSHVMFAEFLRSYYFVPLIMGTFVYFMCTIVVSLCAFY
jgi:hypothetical protein